MQEWPSKEAFVKYHEAPGFKELETTAKECCAQFPTVKVFEEVE